MSPMLDHYNARDEPLSHDKLLLCACEVFHWMLRFYITSARVRQAVESQLTGSLRLHQRFAAEALRAHAAMRRKLEGRPSSAATAAAEAGQGDGGLEMPEFQSQSRSVRLKSFCTPCSSTHAQRAKNVM